MSSLDSQFDVIVVGAGPAGSMAALTLARSNHRVLLVDRSIFPRDKVCGDGLPPLAIRTLQQTGITLDDFGVPDIDYQFIAGLEIGSPALNTLSVNWKPTVYPTIACRRLGFDRVLFDKAVEQGSQFLQVSVEGAIFNNDTVTGIRTRDHGEFNANVVIAADGYGSSVARSAGFRLSKSKAVVSAIRAYARLTQPIKPYFHMHFLSDLRPGYAWLFPVGDKMANVGLGLAASHMNSARLRQALIDYLCDWWGDTVEIQAETLRQWPIPLWDRDAQPRYRNGVFMTGDAGAFVDPLTGGGISAAVLTGIWAAESLQPYLSGRWSLEKAGHYYESLWRAQLKPKLDHMHRVKTLVVDHPKVFSAIFSIASRLPFLRAGILGALSGEHT